MTLVVPQHTDCSINAELQNIVNWSEINKQNINTNKTKEIIFLEERQTTQGYNCTRYPSNWTGPTG